MLLVAVNSEDEVSGSLCVLIRGVPDVSNASQNTAPGSTQNTHTRARQMSGNKSFFN